MERKRKRKRGERGRQIEETERGDKLKSEKREHVSERVRD